MRRTSASRRSRASSSTLPGTSSRATDSELWLGGDPGVLFWSGDGGITWKVNRGLLEHPTREKWQPGAGGMCCHSIQVVDGTIYIAISAAGAFRSDDGGETWKPINKEVAADFHPEKYPEVGQCVHKLLVHPARPDRLWQQNHCGVYRSDDRGRQLGAARRKRAAVGLRFRAGAGRRRTRTSPT